MKYLDGCGDNFAIKGKNGDYEEKNGAFTLLIRAQMGDLAYISFVAPGFSKVPRTLTESSNGFNTVSVELYLEHEEIDVMVQFA